MAIRIPQNQINYKYTSGKEYMFETTYREYQGYYYEINGKLFAGKEFNSNAPILIKIKSDGVNNLLTNAATYTYGKISKRFILKNILPSIPLITTSSGIKYIAKKLNSNPIKIIFISEDTFRENYNKNLLYSFTEIEYDAEWGFTITSQNIRDIPEIETFLKEYSANSE